MKKSNQEWFTIKVLDQSTYVISEYGHGAQTHAQLFVGQKDAALIDTGKELGRLVKK